MIYGANLGMKLDPKFISEMKRIFGEEYAHFASALQKKPRKSIRFHPIKSKGFDSAQSLFADLEPVAWANDGYYVEEGEFPSSGAYYTAGLYYFQEASAMAPVCNMPLKEGMKVLDLCAAPGGKSLQIAAAIGETGALLSNDISVSRQRATLRNIEKFGLKNVLVSAESAGKIAETYPSYFDAILVDAPCSGEGIFAKDKETLQNWTEETNRRYAEKQLELLLQISPALKEGGFLMYSTCTFSDIENEELVKRFLSLSEEFCIKNIDNELLSDSLDSLKGAKRILPHKQDGMGHFLALMEKRSPVPSLASENSVYVTEASVKWKAEEKKKLGEGTRLFLNFCEELGIELESLFDGSFDPVRLRLYSDKLYYISSLKVPPNSFRVLRNGLLLGEIKHGKFFPSQALCMAILPSKIRQKLCFKAEDPNLLKYLKGETLLYAASPGYHLICVDGLSLAWAHSDGKKLKNKLKKDWIQ